MGELMNIVDKKDFDKYLDIEREIGTLKEKISKRFEYRVERLHTECLFSDDWEEEKNKLLKREKKNLAANRNKESIGKRGRRLMLKFLNIVKVYLKRESKMQDKK